MTTAHAALAEPFQPGATVHIGLEVFPAAIRLEDEYPQQAPWRKPVRVVIVTGDDGLARLRYFATDRRTGAITEHEAGIISGPVRGSRVAGWRIPLSDGTEWYVVRDAGCGCGHPLKRFVAYASQTRVRVAL